MKAWNYRNLAIEDVTWMKSNVQLMLWKPNE